LARGKIHLDALACSANSACPSWNPPRSALPPPAVSSKAPAETKPSPRCEPVGLASIRSAPIPRKPDSHSVSTERLNVSTVDSRRPRCRARSSVSCSRRPRSAPCVPARAQPWPQTGPSDCFSSRHRLFCSSVASTCSQSLDARLRLWVQALARPTSDRAIHAHTRTFRPAGNESRTQESSRAQPTARSERTPYTVRRTVSKRRHGPMGVGCAREETFCRARPRR
jgi:hypothetical protein